MNHIEETMAPKKRSLPQKRVRPAKRSRAQKPDDDDDADFVPDNSAGNFVANSTDAQCVSHQANHTNMNQGSIYEAVSRRRSGQLTKGLLADRQLEHSDHDEAVVPSDNEAAVPSDNETLIPSDDESDDPKPDSFEAQYGKPTAGFQPSIRPAALGPPTLTDTWSPPVHYTLPATPDFTKPRHALLAEAAAAAGQRRGPVSEEAAARQHVRHLFGAACPLPSLHGAAIPTEAWLARPHDTLTKGLQEAAAAAARHPALSDAELAADFAAMGVGACGGAGGGEPGVAGPAGGAPAEGRAGPASGEAVGEEEGVGGGPAL